MERVRNTDKSIPPPNFNSFPGSLEIGRENLQKIKLKKFYGDPISSNPFWDSFEGAVDDNPGLSDIDKFNQSRNLLEGPAAVAIRLG